MRGIVHCPRRFTVREFGGTERVVLEISKQQQRQGWVPSIATSQALDSTPAESVDGVPVRRFRHFYPFFGLSSAMRQALDKKGGNLVSLGLYRHLLRQRHTYMFHAHATNRLGGVVRTAARRLGKPYVVSLHGGYFDVPDAERQSLRMPIQRAFEWGQPFGWYFGSRRVLTDADWVICVGQREAEIAPRFLGHDRVSYLPNGVDVPYYQRGDGLCFRRWAGIPLDAYVVLNVSRLDPQKNQRMLLESFVAFRRRCSSAVLVLIGPETSPVYAASLRAFVQSSGLQKSVRIFSGFPPGDSHLADAYAASDVFVLPSIHEPFGIVVLEAWSAGLPVIGSRVGGLASLVDAERTGLFFDPSAPDAVIQLVDRLRVFYSHRRYANAVGQAGCEVASANYAWPVIHQRLSQIYEKAALRAARRGQPGGANE